MPEALTPLERRVYQYMIDFLAENTYQPSIREIAKRFRIKSTKTVSDLLHALTAKGYIERDQSRSRGVRILGFASAGQVQPVPVLADAGEAPLDERQRYVTVDRRFVSTDDTFMLRAVDDGLTGKCIATGDYLMVSPSARAKDGDIVAVRHGASTLVRTLTHRGMTLVLETASDAYPVIELGPKDDFTILGVVTGVFRPFHEQLLPATESAVEESLPVSAAMVAAELPAPPMAQVVS